jgi:molecular chaperone DnaK (HSP70)
VAVYGIDLGFTHSGIAYADERGHLVVLKSAYGENKTPSAVYFESPDNVIVGREAKDSAVLFPDLVAELVKRQIGQDVHYTFHGQDYTPESITALILRELARAAGDQTGETVEDVVITVPAYFGMLEREATSRAGRIAGLNVLDVLAEPVAAALGYQVLAEDAGVRHLFVYDLGGGTFDTTVIRIDGQDIQVVCTDGDYRLGGADWDNKIIEFLLEGLTEANPGLAPDPGGDDQFMQDLVIAAEQLKKALSTAMTRKYNVRFGGAVAQLELTRERLESLTAELLERTMDITERTIATAKLKGIKELDDVLLVGGMTEMPVIARTLQDRFGLAPRLQDPHLAVVKGAAISALGKTAPRASHPATVLPRAVGLKVVDSADPAFKIDPSRARTYISHLLTANTPLPADSTPIIFSTIVDNQREIRLEVWEQAGSISSEELEHNTQVGDAVCTDLPPRPAGTPFEIVFHMTETGLLNAHCREVGSGHEVRCEIQIRGLDELQRLVEGSTKEAGGSPLERARARMHRPPGFLRGGSAQAVLPNPSYEPDRRPGHVFIAYVREDSLAVDKLQHLLETAGLQVWRDTADLWPGEDWRAKIRRAITKDSLVFLACFSANSSSRRVTYQNEELVLAIDQIRLRRPGEPWLIPVRFDASDIPDLDIGGGRTLASIQRVDLFGSSYDHQATRLIESVQRVLGHQT